MKKKVETKHLRLVYLFFFTFIFGLFIGILLNKTFDFKADIYSQLIESSKSIQSQQEVSSTKLPFENIPPPTIPDFETIEFSLKKGWNLVSFPAITPEIENISQYEIKDIFGNIKSIWGYNIISNTWDYFNFDSLEGKLKKIELGKGYWVFIGEDKNVEYEGNIIEFEKIVLNKGWNIIGLNKIFSQTSAPVLVNSDSISNDISKINTVNCEVIKKIFIKNDVSIIKKIFSYDSIQNKWDYFNFNNCKGSTSEIEIFKWKGYYVYLNDTLELDLSKNIEKFVHEGCRFDGEITSPIPNPTDGRHIALPNENSIYYCCDGLSIIKLSDRRSLCYDPTKKQPVCKNSKTESSGWYDAMDSTLKLITYDNCIEEKNQPDCKTNSNLESSCDNLSISKIPFIQKPQVTMKKLLIQNREVSQIIINWKLPKDFKDQEITFCYDETKKYEKGCFTATDYLELGPENKYDFDLGKKYFYKITTSQGEIYESEFEASEKALNTITTK